MSTPLDFSAAGYTNSADWSRLNDLIPSTRNERQEQAFQQWRRDGQTKTGVIQLLSLFGVRADFQYNQAAARVRNVKHA